MEGRPAPAPLRLAAERTSSVPEGGFVFMDGEEHYRIANYHLMSPFLVSLASNTDLWMFVASGGGLTAGRVDADGSLFPYRTVDQLHHAHHHTGPVTLIQVEQGTGSSSLWEPFSAAAAENSGIERNLYKNVTGSRLVFEEINHDLDLRFRYSWAGTDDFGWVRTATLTNRGADPVRAKILDGLRNITPFGAPLSIYQQAGNLVDAYKKSQTDPETGMGIFSLTAGITDRAEALEVLRANIVWCCGLEDFRTHLSLDALAAFRQEQVVSEDRVLNGTRGNYLVTTCLDLAPEKPVQWRLIGDAGRDHVQIADLRQRIRQDRKLYDQVTESLRTAGVSLRRNVASADGIQLSGRPESWSHHFANVLFNNMRGGVFTRNHDVPLADFVDFLNVRNKAVLARHRTLLDVLPDTVTVQELRDFAAETADPDFQRLSHEYLPLYFGRRHGDPSRPWNRFSIRVRDVNGNRALSYEGNWRDIFQNWEALCVSFPGFLPSIVAKFVNASTVDGFNPYRLTREGVDWETVSPDDPWSNIGYWGDHQIIYLQKLLEAMHGHDPRALEGLLETGIFSYAEVPYTIKSYAEILRDQQSTIEFDRVRADRIAERVADLGSDGKLLTGADVSVYHANLFEKLLVPALSKLSNLVPDAGIWMNTQRPEWNDANNALAGGGVSVVTLCYLRRFLAFLADRFEEDADRDLPVSTEIVDWFDHVEATLGRERGNLSAGSLEARDRKRVMDSLGKAFSAYRDTVYAHGFSGRTDLSTHRAAALFRTALVFVDRSIAANRREDGLYHTYNLLEFTGEGAGVEVARLQKMLEGQVAVLSSGFLDPEDSLDVMEKLFASDLYRADQRSFMLYPERELPGFLDKNRVPDDEVASIALLRDLVAERIPNIISRDADGICRFHGSFRNEDDLETALDDLAADRRWAKAVVRDKSAVLALFEDVFKHRSYTGRSGVMYGYEGLGCIYWHMVAKLLVAVQENFLRAEREDASPDIRNGLASMYFRVRAGIGYEKSVVEYGAFPTDPYSHTPSGGGAKQPGMTGQVKEEILTRFGELGVRVEEGAVRFQPHLLDAGEFLDEPGEFRYFDLEGIGRTIPLAPGNLAFTYCQVPVVYEKISGDGGIAVSFADGSSAEYPGNLLDAHLGLKLFSRCGAIQSIRVRVPEDGLSK